MRILDFFDIKLNQLKQMPERAKKLPRYSTTNASFVQFSAIFRELRRPLIHYRKIFVNMDILPFCFYIVYNINLEK